MSKLKRRISRRRRKLAARRIRPVAVHRYHHMWVRQWRVQRRELAFCLETSDLVDQVRDGFMRLTLRVGKRNLTYVFSRAEVGELLRMMAGRLPEAGQPWPERLAAALRWAPPGYEWWGGA